jgi:oxygen-independent coproporphyrinogen-3 oxidase
MCQFSTSWENDAMKFKEINDVLEHLQEMKEDGLLTIAENSIKVTEKGKPFVRNICMAFDLRLIRKAPQTQLFSMTI